MNAPLFSCVIPVKGDRPYFDEALESLRAQDMGDDLEIIVQDADVEPDEGQSDAFNKGFAKARGEWLFWLNADDVLLPGALSKVKELIRRSPTSLNWIVGDEYFIDATGRRVGCSVGNKWHDWLYRHAVPHVHGPSAFFKRELLEKIGGFDVTLKYCMDWDLWIRFMQAGARFARIKDFLWAQRRWNGSKTQRDLPPAERERQQTEIESMLKKNRFTVTRAGIFFLKAWRLMNGCYLKRACGDLSISNLLRLCITKMKSHLQGWIYWMAIHVRPSFAICIINRTLPFGRPVLDYVEIHLADQCNLNCAGCLHYAPFAEKRFADLETVRRDFVRLRALFSNVRHIRLMGGEPLLNRDVASFARVAREAFPKSKIRVVTNGILLEKFDGLAELASLGVGIDWTKYPPVAEKESIIRRLCADAGVALRITANDSFMARLLPNGGEGMLKAFRWCRRRMYCPLLDSGRIYPCAPARFAATYNKRAETEIYAEPGLDIHAATAKEILLYLMRPTFACHFCAASTRHFAWKSCEGPEDWVR